MKLLRATWIVVLLVLSVWRMPTAAAKDTAKAPPNILLILADDLGYSDLGCYGGEIETPNLDRLAHGGLRFTQFYNTARCWPSRASILTGYHAQAVRRDTIPGAGGGANGERPLWAPLLSEMLNELGYTCYHSGKWHVDGMPLDNGFESSYLVQDQDRYFSPRVHFKDDQKLPPVDPGSGYYATVSIAEHAIKHLKRHAAENPGKPFFEYLAFTCPHFPLQALEQDIVHYRGRYREGWDSLRAERLSRMRRLGLVNCELSPRTEGVVPWSSLSDEERKAWQARMSVHAAMVDRMDREIGRVLDQLRAMKAMDNTVILFLSDNGASAERVLRGDGNDPEVPIGSQKSFTCLEPGWANLANTPLRLSKIFVHEGGISTPLIVHWPKGLAAANQLRHNPGHVVDLMPTLFELVGSEKPATWGGQPLPPAPGRSLVPAFSQDGAVEHDFLWWFHSGNRAIRIGDWKLVSEGNKPWELYDLSTDRCESKNLAAEQPQRVEQMQRAWQEYLETCRKLAGSDERT